MASTVSISEETHRLLQDLSREEGQPVQAIIARALETYRRERFLRAANDDYERLRKDRSAWNAELDERKLWEGSLSDGLQEE
jgi:hypothetical protein